EFVDAACGAVATEVGFQWLSGDVPDRATDEQILAKWRAQIKQVLLARLPASATEAGFWFGRAAGHAMAAMAFAGAPKAQFTKLSLVPDAAGGELPGGQLGAPARCIGGYAHQGRLRGGGRPRGPRVAGPRGPAPR